MAESLGALYTELAEEACGNSRGGSEHPELLVKNAERALIESEERYALVTRATQDGIWDQNLATGRCHISSRFKEILGFREDELTNHSSSFFGRIHPDDFHKATHLVSRVKIDRTINTFETELRLERRDGSYCWVVSRGTVVRDEAGVPTRIVGAIHDITQRKDGENAVAFLASIVQSSDDSIIGTGLDGTILSWNAGSERFWGYTAEEAIGKHIGILFPPERIQGELYP